MMARSMPNNPPERSFADANWQQDNYKGTPGGILVSKVQMLLLVQKAGHYRWFVGYYASQCKTEL